jgi:hypothetical protein
MQRRTQTLSRLPFDRLRAAGSRVLANLLYFFFALRAKKKYRKKKKYRCENRI